MMTLGKAGTIHARRLAAARLHQEDAVRILFNDMAPSQKGRPGGYTRIVKLGQRTGDAAHLAILEWVDVPLGDAATPTAAAESGSAPVASQTPAPAAPAAS
jgi:large subunit ribosomal protein L17